MSLCLHGIDRKHRSCERCEEIAEAENRRSERDNRVPQLASSRKAGSDEFYFFDLDPHKLDREWLGQPKIFHEYSTRLADARQDYAEAKAALELVEAELSLEVRLHPLKFDLEKTTEASVNATVLTQQQYRFAQKKLIEAKHKVDVLEAAVNALEHRKRALENLVSLWTKDYFAEPRTPEGAGRAVGEFKADAAFGGKKRRGT